MNLHFIPALVFGSLLTAALGCRPTTGQIAQAEPPVIPVSQPVKRDVTDNVDFTGRANAIEVVNIVPRVTGYLVQIPFKEGAEVKKDDLLFEVDPRPYQAQLDQADGQVKLYAAQLKLAKTTLARDQDIAKTPGAVAPQQIDQDKAAVEEAEARVKAFEASTEVYKLNIAFTKVKSPISGQVSRYFLTTGNLVNQDQTLLTTVVSLDPIHVYFDMDEPTLLHIRRAINEGKIHRPQDGKIPVFMGLQGETTYTHQGMINFVNNQVNPTTGSISVRGVFDNPKPPNGIRLLSPGMFVRIRLPIGQPQPATLVIDRAISSDQGMKFVYVIGAGNKVEARRVTTGALQEDGLRVIGDELKPEEWVVVGGLQQVRPRMVIQTEKIAMPSFRQDSTAAQPAQADSQPGKPETRKENQGSGGKNQESPNKKQNEKPMNQE